MLWVDCKLSEWVGIVRNEGYDVYGCNGKEILRLNMLHDRQIVDPWVVGWGGGLLLPTP